jgi:hypothetical protein
LKDTFLLINIIPWKTHSYSSMFKSHLFSLLQEVSMCANYNKIGFARHARLTLYMKSTLKDFLNDKRTTKSTSFYENVIFLSVLFKD